MTSTPVNTYIAIGPYCWGRGTSVGQAVRRARENLPGYNLRPDALFSVYRVSQNAYVDPMFGDIITPTGEAKPEFIKAIPITKEQKS